MAEPDTRNVPGSDAASDPSTRSDISDFDRLGDGLTLFYSLRHSGSDEADDALQRLGADDDTDREIMLELAAPAPLYRPDQFPAAHALAVRALEVLDRNGTRGIDVPRRLGPLAPVFRYLVQLVTRFIVVNYVRSTIDAMRNLYVRREANTLAADPALPSLIRARRHAQMLTDGFKRNPLGVPSFLLGGAVVSGAVGAITDAVGLFTGSATFAMIAAGVILGLFAVAASAIVKGSAIARRRIRLTAEQPLHSLWGTVGRCGHPPRDQATAFAFIAIVVMTIGFFVIPALLTLVIFT